MHLIFLHSIFLVITWRRLSHCFTAYKNINVTHARYSILYTEYQTVYRLLPVLMHLICLHIVSLIITGRRLNHCFTLLFKWILNFLSMSILIICLYILLLKSIVWVNYKSWRGRIYYWFICVLISRKPQYRWFIKKNTWFFYFCIFFSSQSLYGPCNCAKNN